MSHLSEEFRRRQEVMSREELVDHQLARLNDLLKAILPTNRFYSDKIANCPNTIESLEQLAELPFTTKEELMAEVGAQSLPPNLTFPIEQYVRYHQTSGTHGRPMPVFDTAADWHWWVNCWQYVLDAAEITERDCVLLAFSFGPFIGFWSAYDALVERGALSISSGGMNTMARLDLIKRTQSTALFCTPTYAMHLVEVAEENHFNLAHTSIKKIVVAGEPGGSVAATRERIETAWDAHVTDHGGASETGPWGYGDHSGKGLHVLESEFIAEFISVTSGKPAEEGELSHLVLTPLGRYGMPVIRYRTGDLVRPYWRADGTNHFVFLDGGIVSRADDMMIVRGVNVFPSSLEQILRSFPEVVEFRITVRKRGEMDELVVEVEDRLEQPQRIADEMLLRLGLKVDVRIASAMSLPRFEGKGARFVDLRETEGHPS